MLQTLQTLGQLESVGTKYAVGFNTLEFHQAWDKCTHLREISLVVREPDLVQAAFSTPKKYLKKIDLEVLPINIDAPKEILDTLCKGALYVEEFTMQWYSSADSYWKSLQKFFELNKSFLSHVALNGHYSNTKVNEAIKVLLQETSLKEIRCRGKPDDNLLKTLVKRGIQCREWDVDIYYAECAKFTRPQTAELAQIAVYDLSLIHI